MANDEHELRKVNWEEVVSFSHIFKCFRMAIHPSKMILALAAIVLLFLSGWVLDLIWAGGGERVRDMEIYSYYQSSPRRFTDAQERWEDTQRPRRIADLRKESEVQRIRLSAYKGLLPRGEFYAAFDKVMRVENTRNKLPEPTSADVETYLDDAKDSWSKALGEVEEIFDEEVDRIEELMEDAYDNAEDIVKAATDDARDEGEEKLEKDYGLAKVALTRRKIQFATKVRQIRGVGIFDGLLDYEMGCLGRAISAVRHGRFLTGLDAYAETMRKRNGDALAVPTAALPATPLVAEEPGLVYWMLLGGHGVGWLVMKHWLYAIIFLTLALGICSLLGGAIHRIAALHAAREEKISIRQALKFSTSRFFSFFTAPLIPIAIIAVIGLLVMLGGLALGNWPYLGEILLGLTFILAIVGGLVAAFLMVGLVAGAPLMYPTIAVEGSDSFDAISRGFSYVFDKPWRTAANGVVALVYGVITYLFVRLFVFLALASTHCFVKWGLFAGGGSVGGSDKLEVLWAKPTFGSLFGPFYWEAMSPTEAIGAFLIGVWVFLAAGMVAAYLLSYFASASTVIYYLLRCKVDATDLDDVYVEELPPDEVGDVSVEPVEQAPTGADEPQEQAEAADESTGQEKPAGKTRKKKTSKDEE